MSSTETDARQTENLAVEPEVVKDKAYWKKKREQASKAPEHECARLQQRSLACSTIAGDQRNDVCANAFKEYKDCLQQSVSIATESRRCVLCGDGWTKRCTSQH